MDRKLDHIKLALSSQVAGGQLDDRFFYEPMLGTHSDDAEFEFELGGKKMRYPIWISSMTGGTPLAKKINQNLAKVCKEFGLGMGLGSCRSILDDDTHFPEFDVREFMGDDQPLYANLGVAQVEEMIEKGSLHLIDELVSKLRADGLMFHVNPLQEWLQPEGNQIKVQPIETLKRLLDHADFPVIVKEVGQGMGYESLKKLLQLPVEAIEFGAFGGTNFSLVELSRNTIDKNELYKPVVNVGHTAVDMVEMINDIVSQEGDQKCNKIIISGGIKTFLDGYYLIHKSSIPAIYAQASAFLKYAKESYEDVRQFVASQIKGYVLATNYLRVKD